MNARIMLILLFGTSLLLSCSDTATPTATSAPTAVFTPTAVSTQPPPEPGTLDDFSRRAMLADIGNNVILPLHERFAAETAVLADTLHAFQAEPNATTLAAAQAAWKTAAATWAQAEALDFDRLHFGRVAHWPAEVEFVERLIAEPSYTLDADFIITRGSIAQGLPLIEAYLFEGEQTAVLARLTTDDHAERRLAYLVTSADLLRQTADSLLTFWQPSGKDFLTAFVEADAAANDSQGSLNQLANQMLAALTETAEQKLSPPLAAPFSEQTAVLIVENLRGFQQLFNGGNGFGYDDYLNFVGANALSEQINAQIETAVLAVTAIEEPVETAVVENPEAVQLAREEITTLITLTQSSLVDQLGLVIDSHAAEES